MYHQSSTAIRAAAIPAPGAVIAAGPATLAGVFAGQVIEGIESGAALFWQGDAACDVFEVISGALRTVRILSDGRRVITGFLFPGDVVAASLKDRYPTTVEAIAPTQVRRLGRRRFEEIVDRHPALRPLLLDRLCDEMTAAQAQLVLLACKTAEERVASFLLSLARRDNEPPHAGQQVALPMTRLDIADFLGLTIETVSRIMTRLASRGIIAGMGRHAIALRRPAALAALAVDDEEDEIGPSLVYAH
jgi:CRP/FNR family transcriptional regulator, anaerobic regulatory protein